MESANQEKNTRAEQNRPEKKTDVTPPEAKVEVTDDEEWEQDDPGMRQRENQNQQQEDDLAA